MPNQTVTKLGGLLESIIKMEKDATETARLEKIQAERDKRKTRDEFLAEMAPLVTKLRAKLAEYASLPEADPRRSNMPKIEEALTEVFTEAKAQWEISEEELSSYLINNVFLTEHVMKISNPVSAYRVAEKAVVLGHIRAVSEEEYRNTLDRVRAISAERRKRKEGQPYDGRLANERRTQTLKVSSKEGTGYYVGAGPFGDKVILSLKEKLGGSADKAKTFSAAVETVKLEETPGLTVDGALLQGVTGKFLVEGYHKPKARKDESADSIVGQRYALLLVHDPSDERLTVEKTIVFGAEGAENVFAGMDGKSFPFRHDPTDPDLHELPFELMRFLYFRLADTGWKYPERSQDRTLPTHTWSGGPVVNDHDGGANVVPKAPRRGADNPTNRDLTERGRGGKPQRRRPSSEGKEKGGGNARRYQD